MKLSAKILKYQGQGENPDLSFLVSKFDQQMDKSFGIDYQQIENSIALDSELIYRNHSYQALLTSYLDYHQIFSDLGPHKTLVDLGAGICRGSLLASDKLYNIKCVSVELVKERMIPAENYLTLLGQHGNLVMADIMDPHFVLPSADAYFIYLPAGELMNSILRKLLDLKGGELLYVIESHGDLINNLRFYPELLEEEVCDLKVSTQRHDSKIYKFKVNKNLQKIKFEFQHLKLEDLLKEEKRPWWILKYGHQEQEVLVESRIAGSHTYRQWRANLKGASPILYHQQFALQLKQPARILEFGHEDRIVAIFNR